MEDFEKQLMAYLNGAAMKIKANSDKIAKKHASQLARTIKEASPYDPKSKHRKGHYKDGWGTRKGYSNVDYFEYEVRNSKKYQLTHLLEHGHIAADGTRVKAQPHINSNADAEITAFIEDLKEHADDT